MGNFRDVLVNEEANATLSEFMTHKIRERVRDPEVADKLIPTDHGFGTRRVPLESGYYEVFNQPNVELVDVRDTPIVEITECGIRTTAATHECDVIIFATGFDAVTGSFDKIEVTGVGGESLRDAWAAGPKTYLGLGVAGFPNLFMLVGPHSAASFCNMPRCIEHNVDWLATLLARHEVGGADARLPDPRRARRVDRRGHRGGAADALLEGRLVVHRHAIAELQGSRANCAALHRRLPEVPGTVPRRRRRRLRRLRPRLTAHPHDRLSSSGPMRRSGAQTPPVSASRDVSEHNHRVRYLFGDTVLDTTRYSLYRNEEPQHVEPQVFDVLAHLVENRNRVVSKNELLDQVWGHQFVTESALTTRIKQLRQAVGDTGKDQRVVQTIHGRGYRFIATVQEVADAVERPRLEVPEELRQDIQFCTADDGTRLAFATIGTGPPLVRAAHWITHLDYDWQSPVWRHWLVGLAHNRTLVRYDERGNGLSDHDVDDFSFEAMVRDLETVVDELGLERFPILGLSQGGAIAVTYAARHPERVSHLILVGAYCQGRLARAETDEEIREANMQFEMVRLGWGKDDPGFRRFFVSRFIPDSSVELWDAFAELLRRTTSPANAARAARVVGDHRRARDRARWSRRRRW